MVKKRKSKLQEKLNTYLRYDLNGQFSGRSWLGHYGQVGKAEQALTTDPAIAAGWQGLLSVMAQAQIDFTSSGNCAIDDFLKTMFFKKFNRRFNAFFLDLLNCLIYGVQPFEVLTKYDCGRWYITDFLPIPARNFDLETLTKNPSEFWAVGRCQTERGQVEIGGPNSGKVLVFWPTFGPSILGRSIIRPILNEHEEKSYIRELRSVGLSKSVLGSIAAFERKPDLNLNEQPLNQNQLNEQAQAIAEITQAAEKSAIVFPSQIDKLQTFYPAADAISKTIDAEDHTDLQILTAFGSQHLARGLLSSYGSQGAGEIDTKAQQALRGYFFEWAASVLQPVIDWIIEINFGCQENYPELSIISPTPQSPESLIRSYAQLVGIGAITPTVKDELYFRRLLRLDLTIDDSKKSIESQEKKATRVTGHYDKNGIDTRDRVYEYVELKGE